MYNIFDTEANHHLMGIERMTKFRFWDVLLNEDMINRVGSVLQRLHDFKLRAKMEKN